ncbi:GNAT family N-acetyltransferase [Calidifontimicrobium sp. SYSU G02091]|uniref:GNAT family N-acetyltransferase n=1 Tax=Calidifontimicrobium sp. SYSU G02091 TaxID=2926421 RepID=UPI001F533D02|nr:GNAT family N-acetyltransferase [Calidifontimicrobium sp. SYSU G02091]MCI1191118.1 GNAT family N-acetyltransferase [Calidifontimicrobium sp. SYSU G02091]
MAGDGSTANDYVIRVHDDPAAIDASAWNALLAAQPAPTPFLRHEYLAALHTSGSAVPATGWAPQFVTIERGADLVGACALYLKGHSYGEYVFDWAWADAYRRAGLPYYPKLLAAVPFTPVAGTRLLARDDAVRDVLVHTLSALATSLKLSSVHVLFVDDADRAAFERAGWLLREGVQFHWTQRAAAPLASFDDLLASLQRDKRKKIAQERRRVAEAGVTFTVHRGAEIDDGLWDFFHDCYTRTYRAHRSTPYLTRAFFGAMARTMPEAWLLFVAWRGGERIAASLLAVDDARRSAYGRYWGCTEYVPCLHFEACYYRPLAWCLEHGYLRFEGGAQGEHKMARGLLPVRTTSAHWLRDARFARAVADFVAREGEHVALYVDELNERNPFKPPAEGTGGATAA